MSVIEFEQVSKSYRLGASRTSLREALAQTGRNLLRRSKDQADNQLFWALDDVSFQVEQGDVLGIIGHNGAGKSTALKLLSKVTFPTRGQIHTRGRMAALIELGAGFHPDLSGRENIYLNGAILGLKKREIDAEFSNMVEFAGLEKFIDTPVKRYSSGMYVRLAFAVAAHVKADLLIIDEVLSVGDMSFQQKCLAKMNELRDNGATIVFVSHNLGAVKSFCGRVLLLHSGRIVADGNPSEAIKTYEHLEQATRRATLRAADPKQNGDVNLSLDNRARQLNRPMVELLDLKGQSTREFDVTDGISIHCRFIVAEKLQRPSYEIQVRRRIDGFICFSRYFTCDPGMPDLQGEGAFEAQIEQILLVPGEYTLVASIQSFDFPAKPLSSLPESFSIKGRVRSSEAGIYEPVVEWLSIPHHEKQERF